GEEHGRLFRSGRGAKLGLFGHRSQRGSVRRLNLNRRIGGESGRSFLVPANFIEIPAGALPEGIGRRGKNEERNQSQRMSKRHVETPRLLLDLISFRQALSKKTTTPVGDPTDC